MKTYMPSLVDPPVNYPHPVTNPCAGCPRQHAHSDLIVVAHTRRIYWKRIDVGFTMGEYRVIARLVEAKGEPISYREVYDVIQRPGFHAGACDGDDKYGMRSNVRSMIKRIRRKFEKIDPKFDAIKNYISFGYAWITGPVTERITNGTKQAPYDCG